MFSKIQSNQWPLNWPLNAEDLEGFRSKRFFAARTHGPGGAVPVVPGAESGDGGHVPWKRGFREAFGVGRGGDLLQMSPALTKAPGFCAK